jgi:molybdopterin-dependent oxidoreductase alpha subunit
LDPDRPDKARIGKRKRVAAGVTAIEKSMEYALGEAGVVRGVQTLSLLNQFDGFDCPGCAWPDPDEHRSHNEYCENGAKAIAEEATSKRVTDAFFAEHSVAQLLAQSDYWLGHQGRLTQPMLLEAGASHYAPVEWDDAFALIASELHASASPNRAVFYTSGRTSNEAAFLYQLFAREFGTNNLPDCSNMCHESSGVALTEQIGIGKGTVTLEDFDKADAILVIGQNPSTNHPRMLTALERAARNGATIVSVNPLAETGLVRFKHPQEFWNWVGPGTPLAKHFVRVRLSGDLAFFKGVCKEMLEEDARRPGAIAHAFIERKTSGFKDFAVSIAAASWDEIVEQSGISREQIREIARLVLGSKAVIACWAMGLTQQRQAVATINEVVNMLLLGGHIGRAGAGACPVRGHSNVQGDRTMGIFEKPPAQLLDALDAEFGIRTPREYGYDVVDAIRAMDRGDVDVFFAMGGNFLSATPDTARTARALGRCKLTVHVSTKLNRAHLVTGTRALVLPCLGRTDRDEQRAGAQFVSVENSMGVVHSSRGRLDPPSEHLLSEPAIVARLAYAALGARTHTPWLEMIDDYDRIRDRIARVIPGCENYNERVRRRGGFYLPNAARNNEYHTATKRANFVVSPIEPLRVAPGRFVMTTIRSHDQYNTTIYGLDDRYRGIYGGRRVVFINADEMNERGWTAGQELDVTSYFDAGDGEETRRAERFKAVPYDIPRRCVAAYFPEANVLVPIGSVALASNTPTSKAIVVSLDPSPVV